MMPALILRKHREEWEKFKMMKRGEKIAEDERKRKEKLEREEQRKERKRKERKEDRKEDRKVRKKKTSTSTPRKRARAARNGPTDSYLSGEQ